MAERIFLYPYAGPGGKNYLKQLGTIESLQKANVVLQEGLTLSFYCDDANNSGQRDDLYFEGEIHFDAESQSWYAIVDERSYQRASTNSKQRN